MNNRCPYCKINVFISHNSLGKINYCPNCHNSFFVPADGNSYHFKSELSQKSNMNIGYSLAHPAKECPHCHKKILAVSDRCIFCHKYYSDKIDTSETIKETNNVHKINRKLVWWLIILSFFIMVVAGVATYRNYFM